MSDLHSILKSLVCQEKISAIPWKFGIKPDGHASKYPGLSKDDNWSQFRDRLPNEQDISNWEKRGLLKGPGPGTGINCITGRISNLTVIDCDDDAAISWVEKHLDSEDKVLRQRTGNGGRHFIFRYDKDLRTADRAIDGLSIDILGDRKQMIFAPSQFQNGTKLKSPNGTGKYELLDGMKISDRGQIPAKLKAVILDGMKAKAKAKPKKSAGEAQGQLQEGKRNSEMFKIACDFVRKGLTGDNILYVLDGINRARCNPPLNEEELKSIAESATSVNTSPDQAIERLNKNHYYGIANGKSVVYQQSGERKNGQFKLTEMAISCFYNNQKPYYIMDGKKKKAESDIWLSSLNRNELKEIIFDPDKPPFITKDEDGLFIYNRYHGFAVEPKKGGSWELFQKHIRDIICGGNVEHYAWVFEWMGNIVQRKFKKCGKVLVLVGENGTGKSTFARLFGKIFGEHYAPISNKNSVVGNFNGILQGKVLVNLDDTLFRNDHQSINILKVLVTEEHLTLNQKYKAEETIDNNMSFIISSNSTDPIPLQSFERRYVVIEMKNDKRCDFEYFQKMEEELERGGYEAMLYDLLNAELDEEHLRNRAPKTEIMAENQLENLSPLAQWFHGVLENGYVNMYERGELAGQRPIFDQDIHKDELFRYYQQWCEYYHHRFNVIHTKLKFSTSLQKLCPSIKYKDIRLQEEGKRGQCAYRIPAIDICRKEFEASQGVSIQWDD